jgi:ubiquinone/menaquinone biosynthesis C-methylase UbiE
LRADDVQSLRNYVLSFIEAEGGSAVLDLGCGRGTDLVALGSVACAHGKLVGLDASADAVQRAQAATQGDARYSFLLHDISAGLPFPDESFDCVLSTNTLECVTDKSAFLKEVHRVLRPDGSVVFAHFDWDTQVFDGEDKGLIRKLVHSFADWQQAWMQDSDAWMGRRLWPTFQQTGLFVGSMHSAVLMETAFEPGRYGFEQAEAFAALVRRGKVDATDYMTFVEALRSLNERDCYLYAITMFIYAGRRA